MLEGGIGDFAGCGIKIFLVISCHPRVVLVVTVGLQYLKSTVTLMILRGRDEGEAAAGGSSGEWEASGVKVEGDRAWARRQACGEQQNGLKRRFLFQGVLYDLYHTMQAYKRL